MIELSKHIESLLLKHDCVIVPGLGGFVTQYVPARRIDDEMLFLPPCRSVGFNPQLTLNDGLLVQSYMQAYDTNYPETVKLINNSVQQLKIQLQEEGEYELSGIGKLTLGVGGKYNFIPCEAGVLSPELYGLDAVTQPLLTKKDTGQAEEGALKAYREELYHQHQSRIGQLCSSCHRSSILLLLVGYPRKRHHSDRATSRFSNLRTAISQSPSMPCCTNDTNSTNSPTCTNRTSSASNCSRGRCRTA